MRYFIQIWLFLVFITLTSCVTLYKPNAIQSPMLQEKGDFSGTGSLGVMGIGSYNLQAAYAVSGNTGIMIDGMYHNRDTKSGDNLTEKLNLFSAEAGIGHFRTFGEKKNQLFQFYGGGGYGFSSDKMYNTSNPNPEVNANLFNLFIQPGLVLVNPNFSIAFDMRVNYIHLFKIHATMYQNFEWWNTDFHYYSDTTLNFATLEPTITMKIGSKKLRGIVQFGATIPAINPHAYFMANTSSLLLIPLMKFSVGINYTIGKK
jgi:hypothetical protein